LGQNKLREKYKWSIANIKHYESYDLSKFHLIILDEVQRVYKHQLEAFLDKIKDTNVLCIFSYDSAQCLSSWEIKQNIPQFIKDQVSPKHYRLSEKIRTNKEIGSFVKNLFDLSKGNPKQVYTNINIHYFKHYKVAKEYMDVLKYQGWKIINYTPSRYDRFPYDNYQGDFEDTAHNVVRQEFDNVVAVLDQYFYYAENGKLSTKGWANKPYYHPTKMLFQIVSRTRKRLSIIIISNEAVLNECLKIINRQN
jgi:hypothetical protein